MDVRMYIIGQGCLMTHGCAHVHYWARHLNMLPQKRHTTQAMSVTFNSCYDYYIDKPLVDIYILCFFCINQV